MYNKQVVVLNGAGGVGKDTLIRALREVYPAKHISSITPIKRLARTIGWNEKKTLRDRKFLADLKRLTTEYNNYSEQWLRREVIKFVNPDRQSGNIMDESDLLFIDIREPEMIESFKQNIFPSAITLLITRPRIDGQTYGNHADDDVANYMYDLVYNNDKPLEEAGPDFVQFVRENIIDR